MLPAVLQAVGIVVSILILLLHLTESATSTVHGAFPVDHLSHVDPLIGTGGFGFGAASIPAGVQVPFGACRFGPDTYSSPYLPFQHFGGYSYGDTHIRAFSTTHMVGPGASDLGNIGFMVTKSLTRAMLRENSESNGIAFRSRFSHEQEVAQPGYYSVYLQDVQATAELAPGGTHSGCMRIAFNGSSSSSSSGAAALEGSRRNAAPEEHEETPQRYLVINACHTVSPVGDHACRKAAITNITTVFTPSALSNNGRRTSRGTHATITVSGWVVQYGSMTRRNEHGVTIWFQSVYEFVINDAQHTGGGAAAAVETGVWENNALFVNRSVAASVANSVGAFIRIADHTLLQSSLVEMSVGISFISAIHATQNLRTQLPANMTFDQVRVRAQDEWRKRLAVVDVVPVSAGIQGDEDLVIFYSGLFRTMLAPTTFTESSGEYMGFDDRVHMWPYTGDSAMYTDLSLWDVHRSELPWLLLVAPSVFQDIVRSLVQTAKDAGDIPKWPLLNVYTDSMIGSHGMVSIADAWVKGIRDFDVEAAYFFMKRDATEDRPHGGRTSPQAYIKYGYLPLSESKTAVSRTLAYSFDDHAVSVMAGAVNNSVDERMFLQRSKNYRNVWNADMQLMCPRYENGSFDCPTKDGALLPYPFETRYVEGDAWQWLWFVPHDVPGLIDLFPSKQAFMKKLTTFMDDAEGWVFGNAIPNPYYWAGNEPDILAPWLASIAGFPEKTAESTRHVLRKKYTTKPSGVPGNDDYGTLTAWSLFAYLGFYPLSGSATYSVGSPVFSKVTIHREGGDITIMAHNASAVNLYVQSMCVNGVCRPALSGDPLILLHDDFARGGGVLEFTMGATPPKSSKKFRK